MDKRTRCFIAKGAAVLGLAAAGAAVYKNRDDEKLFALGIRRSFGKNDVKRDAGLKAPEDVVRVTDLAYALGAGTAHEASTGTAHEASAGTAREASAGAAQARSANAGKLDPEQLLDIYYPAGTTEPLPTIVSVHGGAQLRHVRAGPGQGDDAHQVLFGLREGRPLGKDGRAGKHHGRLPAVLCHDGDGGFPEAQRGAYGTAADAAGRGKRGARVRRGGRRGAGTCVPLQRAQPLRAEVQRG